MLRRRAFTLVEMLVALGIVTILLGVALPALWSTGRRAHVARAEAQLQALETALAAYAADYRALPRTIATGSIADVLRDDAPALYAGLMNAPAPLLGGGRSGPYLKSWDSGIGALLDRSRLEPGRMGEDGDPGVRPLEPALRLGVGSPDVQARHHPRSAQPLVLLDPWDNPWHYRPWRDVSDALEEQILATPPLRAGFGPAPGGGEPPVAGPVEDVPHDRYGYDLWSNGPNGVNEYGAEGSDDVCTWR